MPERILLVQPSAGMRGPQRTIVAFASWLSSRHEVTLATPRGWVLKEAERRSPNVRTLLLPGEWAADPVASSRRLAAFARTQRPDVIHANGLSALKLVLPAARLTGTPVFVHAHGSDLPRRTRTALHAIIAVGADLHVYGVSAFANSILDGTPLASRIEGVLPNPVEEELFPGSRRAFGSPTRVGALLSTAPHKGLARFVDVAVAAADLDVEWHLFGLRAHENPDFVRGVLEDADRRGVGDRIVSHGAVHDPATAFAVFDILLVPSDRESFCRVAIEGMAAGCPVVATNVPGLAEVVTDGETGLTFDAARPDEGARAVGRLIDDPSLRAELIVNGSRAAATYRVEAIGPELEAIYARLIGPRGRSRVPA